jgi:hypothetical protein
LIITIAVIVITASAGTTVDSGVTAGAWLSIFGTIVFIVVIFVMQYRQGT